MEKKVQSIINNECEELRDIRKVGNIFNLKKMVISAAVPAFVTGLIAALSAEDDLESISIFGYRFAVDSDSFLGGGFLVFVAVFLIIFLVSLFIDYIHITITYTNELQAKNLDCNLKIMKLLAILAGDGSESPDENENAKKREEWWKCPNCGRENAHYVGTCACGTQRNS